MTLARLISFGVATAAVACLVVMWGLFGTMWARGDTQITVATNRFGEFAPEFALLTLAIVFLPVAVYEIDQA